MLVHVQCADDQWSGGHEVSIPAPARGCICSLKIIYTDHLLLLYCQRERGIICLFCFLEEVCSCLGLIRMGLSPRSIWWTSVADEVLQAHWGQGCTATLDGTVSLGQWRAGQVIPIPPPPPLGPAGWQVQQGPSHAASHLHVCSLHSLRSVGSGAIVAAIVVVVIIIFTVVLILLKMYNRRMRMRRGLEPKGPKPSAPSAPDPNSNSSQHPATVTFGPVDVHVET
uniref:Noncompact myelin-associated protein n=1 Tax=Oryctolagus cuniculus TaxID=9986 RepID=A0A5F9CS48_RABIT